ncbi:trans-aconitate 2-methyltransferase [Streptacidiphilus sp. EB129]|uniref:class I SAM-dependent methyltransferase n=1 Tax=Streptacidiphilus sp. EB129 TaxID=3156262 RepID=UPI00351574C2
MAAARQKFDGLSVDYDRYRPRYPAELMRRIADRLTGTVVPHIVDTGAGTGVGLEGLIPLTDPRSRYRAVDLSADMVSVGRSKFPQVDWAVGPAEPFLESMAGVDLVLAAQAFQWMDRPRFLAAARHCLNPGGLVAVIQNNRDFTASPFLNTYEVLLEEFSPGYSRSYRDFDFAAELAEGFAGTGARVETATAVWVKRMHPDEFIGMSRSSTQAQRAIAAHGEVFGDRLRDLVHGFAEGDGGDDGAEVAVPYRAELFTVQLPPAGAGS